MYTIVSELAGESYGYIHSQKNIFARDKTFLGKAAGDTLSAAGGAALTGATIAAVGIGGAASLGSTVIAGAIGAELLSYILPNSVGKYLPTLSNVFEFIGDQYFSFTDHAHPVMVSPVLYHGRPLIAAVPAEPIPHEFMREIKKLLSESASGISEVSKDLYSNQLLDKV